MSLAIIAIGVPGSGKTTILKPLAEKHGLAYINKDDIREELTGDANDHSRDQEVWQLANERAAEAVEQGMSVILDGTYAEPWKRMGATALLTKAGATRIIGLFADTPLEIAKEQNRTRDRVVDASVIEWMHEQLVTNPPSPEEGFDAILTMSELEAIGGMFTPDA